MNGNEDSPASSIRSPPLSEETGNDVDVERVRDGQHRHVNNENGEEDVELEVSLVTGRIYDEEGEEEDLDVEAERRGLLPNGLTD